MISIRQTYYVRILHRFPPKRTRNRVFRAYALDPLNTRNLPKKRYPGNFLKKNRRRGANVKNLKEKKNKSEMRFFRHKMTRLHIQIKSISKQFQIKTVQDHII